MITTVSGNDIHEISELIAATVSSCIDADPVDITNIIDDCIKHEKWAVANPDDCAHYLYRQGNRIVGIILIVEFWNMSALFVHPEHHRRGVAARLVDHALEECRENSPKKLVRLNSSTYAEGFYKKYGFKSAGDPKPLPGGCIPFEYKF